MSWTRKPSDRMLSAIRSAPCSVPAVDQDVAVAADDQDRRDPARADQIGVGVDADRRRGLVPVVRSRAFRNPQRSRRFDRRTRLLDNPRRLAQRDAKSAPPSGNSSANIAGSIHVDHAAGCRRRAPRVASQRIASATSSVEATRPSGMSAMILRAAAALQIFLGHLRYREARRDREAQDAARPHSRGQSTWSCRPCPPSMPHNASAAGCRRDRPRGWRC